MLERSRRAVAASSPHRRRSLHRSVYRRRKRIEREERSLPATGSIAVSAERTISAPAETVYRILADDREHHPTILPPASFHLRIEEGGVEAGTVFSFKVTLGGRTTSDRQLVSEPELGRVLTETGVVTGAATACIVAPEGVERCRVRIATSFRDSGGVRDPIERLLAPRMLRKLYAQTVAVPSPKPPRFELVRAHVLESLFA